MKKRSKGPKVEVTKQPMMPGKTNVMKQKSGSAKLKGAKDAARGHPSGVKGHRKFY